ncbi:hypothetical protein [Kocuria sp. HSID16901]|uniref:hypothetical protein n=1 Tax=Kocuria sp. HSID16901 TaxID=2419505 RepID=UPI00065FCCE5|nr:hypothetical protein [Kocuria sp. HSID16901]RUQ23471.1 hypothetical protein D8M21_01860 [Kocuria sp. HSID16901]
MARHLQYKTTLPMHPQEVWNRVGPALDALGGRNSRFDGPNTLKNDTGASALSWGETIIINVFPGQQATDLIIRSENTMVTQLTGMGRHRKNIDKILEGAGLQNDPNGQYTKGF